MIKLIKAFRTADNEVKVLYLHNQLKYEFVVTYSNINPGTGETEQYDLQLECLSTNQDFNERVIEAISNGESAENPDIDLYLSIRDTFDAMDCESCE